MARDRVFSTGQGSKADVTDARTVAVFALRTPGLRSGPGPGSVLRLSPHWA
jgi:hypothetical protein